MTRAARRMTISPEWLYVGLSQLALLAIGLHWAQPPTGIAQIDLPPPYDPANLLQKTAPAWNHVVSYIGSVDGLFSLAPYLALEALLEKTLGLSVGQAVLFIVPVMASWQGAYRCGRVIGLSAFAAFVTAWVFAFIPVRQQMIGVFLSAEVCMAALPWVFFWAMAAAREPVRRRTAAFWLALISSAGFAVIAVTPQLIAAVLIGLAAWLWMCATSSPDARAYWRWAGTTAAIAIGVSLWWLLPIAISYLGVRILHPIASAAVAWTFARASIVNELRFCATWVWRFPEYNPWAVAFDQTPWLYASGFVAAAGTALALAVTRGRERRIARFCAILMLAMLFLAKGVHAPLAALNEALLKLPGMFLLIEPYGLILVAALAAALACGLAVDALRARPGRGGRAASAVAGAVLVCGMLANNLATVTGAIFHEQTNILPNVHITLPQEWRSVAARLDQDGSPGGVLVLPADDFYQIDYTWGYHGVDLIPIEALRRDVLMPGAPFNYTQTAAAASINAAVATLARARSPLLAPVLLDLGIRYVVVRDDVRFMHRSAPSRGWYAAALGARPEPFGALELYDLGSASGGVEIRKAATRAGGSDANLADSGLREIEHVLFASGFAANAGASEAAARVLALSQVRRTSRLRDLRSDERSPAAALPAVVSQVSTSGTTVAYDVRNPAPRTMTVQFSVGVWPRSDTRFVLTADGLVIGSSDLKASATPRWAGFDDVRLSPGITHLTVTQYPASGGTLQMFLPPRFTTAGPEQPIVNQVRFARIKSDTKGVAPRQAARRMRGADIGLSLATDPQLTVSNTRPDDASGDGWLIDVKSQGRTYGCYADIARDEPFDLGDAVRHCMSSIGRTLTDSDDDSTSIVRITASGDDAAKRAATLTLAYAQTADPSDRAVLAAAARRIGAAHQTTGGQTIEAPRPALGFTLQAAGDGPRELVLSEAFSPTWTAMEFGRGIAFPPHNTVDGWRNAWLFDAPGTLVVFNWLDALEIAFAILALVALAILGVRSRW